MTDVIATVQIVLEDAGYSVWLEPIEQFGQVQTWPHAEQMRDVLNPRRFKKRMHCSRFLSRSRMASQSVSESGVGARALVDSSRMSMMRMRGILR